MKTRRVVAAAVMMLFMATPFFGAMAAGSAHKIKINGLIVDSLTPGTDSNTIIGHKNSITYTITTTSKTRITRKYGARAPFSEMNEGDSLTVWGMTMDGTTITAKKISDNSLRKMLAFGTVVLKAPDDISFPGGIIGAFLMVTNRQTPGEVLVYGNTKFFNGKHRITYADLQPGDVISARGLTDVSFSLMDIIYNTTQVRVRSHGAVPSFPLSPTFFKVSH